jgi:hypothetical protein
MCSSNRGFDDATSETLSRSSEAKIVRTMMNIPGVDGTILSALTVPLLVNCAPSTVGRQLLPIEHPSAQNDLDDPIIGLNRFARIFSQQ